MASCVISASIGTVPEWLATTRAPPTSGMFSRPRVSTRKYFSYNGRTAASSTCSVRSGSKPKSSTGYSPVTRRRRNASAPATFLSQSGIAASTSAWCSCVRCSSHSPSATTERVHRVPSAATSLHRCGRRARLARGSSRPSSGITRASGICRPPSVDTREDELLEHRHPLRVDIAGQPAPGDEVVEGLQRFVLRDITEVLLQAGRVDTATELQELHLLGREVDHAGSAYDRTDDRNSGRGDLYGDPAGPPDRLRQQQHTLAGNVERPTVVADDRLAQHLHAVVLVHELCARVEAEDPRHDRQREVTRQWGVDPRPDEVGEAQQGDVDVGSASAEPADVALDLGGVVAVAG